MSIFCHKCKSLRRFRAIKTGAAILLALLPVPVSGEPASDQQMASEAFTPFASKDPGQRQLFLEAHRDRLYGAVQDSPDAVRPATILFSRGQNVDELQALMDKHELEVMDAHVKAPQGDNGVVMSVMFGSSGLLASEGSLSSRLTFVIDAHRKCFEKSADFLPADEAPEWRALTTTTFRVYSVKAFGSVTSLQELQDHPHVASVMLNLRQTEIGFFEEQKTSPMPNVYKMPGFLC